MVRRWSVAIAILAVAGGCGSTHYREDEWAAKEAVRDAKEAGASKESLRIAEESIEFARRADRSASSDLDQAAKDVKDAEARHERAVKRQVEHRSRLSEVEALLDASQGELVKLKEREENLRWKGVSEEEIKTVTGAESGLARLRIETLKTSRDTLKKQLELCDLELRDADIHLGAARSRTETARQRLEVARALLRQAELQARVARGEALAMQRAWATKTLSSTP